jgi:flavin reductase (DIM6/NTAB) family NADH-FMN oxidoreductase RutF
MQEISFDQYSAQVLQALPKGAFLTVSHGGRDNTMTIGWGSLGVIWGKPIFSVLVRPSRFTFGLLEASGEFSVSVPLTDMSKALAICGSKSGRDIDKFTLAELKKIPGMKGGAPIIGGAGLHYECKVGFKQSMNPALLDSALGNSCYPNGDYHTLYYGLIEATWLE